MWPFNSIEKRLRHFSEAVITLQRKVNRIESLESWVNHKCCKVEPLETNQAFISERLRAVESTLEHQRIEKTQDKVQKSVKAKSTSKQSRKRTRRASK